MAKIYSNNNIIFLIILLILGIVSALIFINENIDYKNDIKEQNCSGNLTYAFYNVTNQQITYKKSDIPVCNVNK